MPGEELELLRQLSELRRVRLQEVTGDFSDCPAPALFLSKNEAIETFSRYFSVNSLSEITIDDCINSTGCSSMFECICSAI